MKTVLFLCTGNSARSQLAEAIVNARHADSWRAYSAGVKPAGYVHPMALAALKEMGITHAGESKHIDQLPTRDFDLVITVCDSAAEECPIWPGRAGRRMHHSYPDPAKVEGTDEVRIAAFREVRDLLLADIPRLLSDDGR